MTTVYDFTARRLGGADEPLDTYRGKVLLIVNVASHCGFTPQYRELEALYQQYAGAGFTVLGFPCDQFRHQEPGDDADIARFCALNYGVSFPMFSKIEVNGPGAHPLYRWLRDARRGVLGTSWIKWNFTKFLVDRTGRPIARYAPATKPMRFARDIDQALRA